MTRSTTQIVREHIEAVNAGALPAVLQGYAEDVVLLTRLGSFEGKAAATEFYAQALSLAPEVRISIAHMVTVGDFLTLWWTAQYAGGRVDDGVDTFLVRDDLISMQSASFTLTPVSAG